MGKVHRNRKKWGEPKSEINALAPRKINTNNRKQTPTIQSSNQTQFYLWHSAIGDSLKFQYRNNPTLSIQNSPIHSERTLVHKQSQDSWRSTNEHSAQRNKKWSAKFVFKQIRKPY
jgi:hypothetical protein